MKKSNRRPPYLHVVPPATSIPSCPPGMDPILWQQFLAIDGILDGHYDQWIRQGAQGIPIRDDPGQPDDPAPGPDGPDVPDAPTR